ncbi:MAG TPA: hypothetical protein VNC11_11945 [Gemmatimonadaceae bacterium]|jgi:hypothetical protein|nr:hypothetical protein [Gemmatimonadaceae bacterium]
MKPNVVAYPIAALLLMSACNASDSIAAKQMTVPTALNPEAINYITNERDVLWTTRHYNPCNGDSVDITASSHWIIFTGFDNAGGFHYSANVVAKGNGASPSKAYKINEQFRYVEQDIANSDGYVIRQRGTLKVDGPGTADDFYEVVVFKTTVTNNGVPTAYLETTSAQCTE